MRREGWGSPCVCVCVCFHKRSCVNKMFTVTFVNIYEEKKNIRRFLHTTLAPGPENYSLELLPKDRTKFLYMSGSDTTFDTPACVARPLAPHPLPGATAVAPTPGDCTIAHEHHSYSQTQKKKKKIHSPFPSLFISYGEGRIQVGCRRLPHHHLLCLPGRK